MYGQHMRAIDTKFNMISSRSVTF